MIRKTKTIKTKNGKEGIRVTVNIEDMYYAIYTKETVCDIDNEILLGTYDKPIEVATALGYAIDTGTFHTVVSRWRKKNKPKVNRYKVYSHGKTHYECSQLLYETQSKIRGTDSKISAKKGYLVYRFWTENIDV